jgi:hypothetical protein
MSARWAVRAGVVLCLGAAAAGCAVSGYGGGYDDDYYGVGYYEPVGGYYGGWGHGYHVGPGHWGHWHGGGHVGGFHGGHGGFGGHGGGHH